MKKILDQFLIRLPYKYLASILHRLGNTTTGIASYFYRRSNTKPVDLPTFGNEFDYTSDEEKELKERQKELNEKYLSMKSEFVLRNIFELMEDYELEYFRDHCLEESRSYRIGVRYAARLAMKIGFQCNAMDVEIEMHSSTSELFTFMFNKFIQYITIGQFEFNQLDTVYDYLDIDLEPFYEYEMRRRFAESLEADLPKGDTPKQKRTKI